MLECRTCVLRCIRAIANDLPLTGSGVRSPLILTPRLSTPFQRRRHASTATDERTATQPSNHRRSKAEIEERNKEKGLALRQERALLTELEYLKDPAKLAEHVHYTLRDEKPQKALELCRLASKNMSCIVSWNHVVDWHMKRGYTNEAIKIYNEMKKRGQFPDSYTYMLLFRGFPQLDEKNGQRVREGVVNKATTIYNSMTLPTSRVKPSIMHTNAVLRLCALAGDMDALWGVASKIPEHGPGSADAITYTTLLKAIRFDAVGSFGGMAYVEQIGPQRQRSVNEGRRIWLEVIAKWRSGELLLDAELVSQMGSLLRVSKRIEDWDDILSLVQQTTNIERQIAPVGSPERRIEHVRLEDQDEDSVQRNTSETEDPDGWIPTPASNAFKPVSPHAYDPQHPKRPSRLAWVQPENTILNNLIRACTLMRIPKTAIAYWNIITSEPYSVKPDLANCQAILRLYAINRTSARAASLVREMHAAKMAVPAKIYRDAMDVCARNHKSSLTMGHARDIIDSMQQHTTCPDVQTLRKYLSLATTSDSGHVISAALDRLDPFVRILQNHTSRHRQVELQEEAAGFYRNLIGVIDTLLSRELVPQTQVERLNERRSFLNALLTHTLKSVSISRHHSRQDESTADVRDSGSDPQGGALQRRNSDDAYYTFTPTHASPERKSELKKHQRLPPGIRGLVGHKRLNLRTPQFADSPGDLAMREH